MADFVAVIRRAVDGLANNTPEMRIRVYEKARGAVQRQLESMKPQPSEDMLRRQMEKLEAAIRDVEAEHREAAPPDDDASLAAAQPDETIAEAPAEPVQAYEEPSEAAAAEEAKTEAYHQPQDEIRAEPVYGDYPAQTEPEPLPVQPYDVAGGHYARQVEPELVTQPVADTPSEHNQPDHSEDARITAGVQPETRSNDPFADEDDVETARPVPPIHHGHFDQASITTDEAVIDSNTWVQQETKVNPRDETTDADEPVEAYEAPVSERPVSVAPAWPDAPSTAPFVAGYGQLEPVPERTPEVPARSSQQMEEHPWADEADYKDVERGETSAKAFDDKAAAELFSAHFEEPTHVATDARMPPVSDFPDLDPAPSQKSELEPDDPFADFVSTKPDPASVEKPEQSAVDPWNDLEELIGYDKTNAAATGAVTGAAGVTAARAAPGADVKPRDQLAENQELEELMAQPVARPYRVVPKPKRNYVGILLGFFGLAIMAGGGYAIWLNRDALSGLIGGADSAAPSVQQAAQPTGQTAPTATPATQTPPAKQTAAATPAAQSAGSAKPGEPQKFTQRLMPDGTEKDSGSGGPTGAAGNQSVAQVSPPAASAQPPAGNAAVGNGASTPNTPAGATAPGVPPSSPPANTVAVAGNKIFLYEERVGQSSPTAVEGSVSWSLQKEAVENGRTEPAVQGRISIPGRGLTALVTFKRNTDPSLPASHLVEFVFSLPPNFEGGSIDSVQRISMKQTEQDRGDPLVAVPAKITPDFHMIALNDFPDARTRNLDLIRSRDWIDVPLIYSNGRRALLTMQKGDDGRKAFDEATRVWQAAASQQGQ
ncbi:hypothetical protein MUU53_14760 [Rhizobium lemnae]|uniref:Transcriptional regulator n=1 Tax=Rhizobium lemnae TaxID=1214924 RepID=A0ABV8E4M7_9HYPH|nr:hypothetical protein [Rhizobium lemnae]MCJ8509176.1 hypothetical protein [Rhizobium lemnae]